MATVKVVESEQVFPSEDTPNHRLSLSNLDIMHALKLPTPLLYVYYPNGDSDFFNVAALKLGLSKALVPYYPLAGRLDKGPDGRLEIDCNSKGALFVVARSETCIDEFGDFLPSPEMRRLLTPSIPVEDPAILLMVQDSKISLKLLVDVRQKKVLFAEGGKDFVDFIFSLLTLPVGSVIRLLSSKSMTGCIAKLYQSVEKINETYLLPNKSKETLLHPKAMFPDGVSPLLLGSATAASQDDVKYYRCGRCFATVTTTRNTMCPGCRSGMTNEMSFVSPTVSSVNTGDSSTEGGGIGGFVKSVVTYMITDDLEVTPMSAISSITLINKYGVKKDGVELEEKMVHVGMKEGIALLKASLGSKTALTDVFYGKSSPPKSPSPSA